jgi:sugar phosphate isomerase/epimerase
MNTTRRRFLASTTIGLAAVASGPRIVVAASNPSLARPSKLKLGLVTYNLAKEWEVPTIIKNCERTGFLGVELRTTHGHGVEVALSKAERNEVRHRFEDSSVEWMGLGSAFDYHTPDQANLKADIAATKEYMLLAEDVGASGVKVRPNGFPREVSRQKTLEQIGRSLLELGRFGADHGQQIRLEVHGRETSFPPHIRTIMDVADHPNVGVCWNSNDNDLSGEGFDHNFDLLKHRILSVHMRDLCLDNYPFRRLLARLNETGYKGYCLAEIPGSTDPIRVMRYYRALFLAYQGLL